MKYALATLLFAAGVASAGRGLAPPGLYTIEVSQDGASKAAEPMKIEACLSSTVLDGEAFLSRLDDVLKTCPMTDIRFNNEEFLYRSACTQADAPKAKAKFVQTRTGYEGTITISNGANKKVIERHRAQRIGECAAARSPFVMGVDAQEWRERRLRGQW